jgi:hypothetical protein
MKMYYFQDVLRLPVRCFISQKDVLSFQIILICVRCFEFSNHLGVMKDKELKLEEIETSHTLGDRGKVVYKGEGSGEGGVDTTLVSNTFRYISQLVSTIHPKTGGCCDNEWT